MPLSTIFQLYRGDQFYWRKPEYPVHTITKMNNMNMECVMAGSSIDRSK